MKWKIVTTVFVISMLILTSAHALENQESNFEEIKIYYFQPINIDDSLLLFNITETTITNYKENFQFTETIKEVSAQVFIV